MPAPAAGNGNRAEALGDSVAMYREQELPITVVIGNEHLRVVNRGGNQVLAGQQRQLLDGIVDIAFPCELWDRVAGEAAVGPVELEAAAMIDGETEYGVLDAA